MHILQCFEDVRVAVVRMQLLFTTAHVLPMQGAMCIRACEHLPGLLCFHKSACLVWNIVIEPDEKCELDENTAVTDGQLEMSLSIAKAIEVHWLELSIFRDVLERVGGFARQPQTPKTKPSSSLSAGPFEKNFVTYTTLIASYARVSLPVSHCE
eukprot:5855724-Amphidinium_carterae.1